MKNISIFINSMGKGGAEKIVSTLLPEFLIHYNVHLVLLSNEVVYNIPREVSVTNLNTFASKNLFIKILSIPIIAYKYKKFCLDRKIKISLSLLNRSNFTSLMSKFFGNKAKLIISEHIVLSRWRSDEKVYSNFLKLLVKMMYPIADNIVVVSKYIKYDLITNYNLNEKKIKVVYNPHNLNTIDNLKLQNTDGRFQKLEKVKTIVSVGNICKRKGFGKLIKAFSCIDDKKSRLIILGEGEEKKALEGMVLELKLSSRVFFLGFVDNPYKYLNNSDIFILASDNEGLPNVIIEALACGCAVISTDCLSGPREILSPKGSFFPKKLKHFEDAEYGILTPVDNIEELKLALNSLVNDNLKLLKYREKSVKRALDFQLNTQSAEYINIFDSYIK